jgi:dipeptidyl aminopeptidase/acylaminoacyl peptidase
VQSFTTRCGVQAALMLAAGILCMQPSLAQVLAPNANLRVENIPPVSMALVNTVEPYTEFRTHSFAGWHPTKPHMLVRHREKGADIAQLFWLRETGGALEKITDFSDPIGGAALNPIHGNYLVYGSAKGGSEAARIYRYDLDTKVSTLLSSPNERSSFAWSNNGEKILLSAVPIDQTASQGTRPDISTTISLVDPLQVVPNRELVSLPGGGWGGFRFSPDDKRIVSTLYRSPSDSEVWVLDSENGERERLLPRPGEPAAGYGDVRWSKDQDSIFFTSNQGTEFFQLWRLDLQTGSLKIFSNHIPWDIQGISLSHDGLHLLAEVNNNGSDEVRLFDAKSGSELPRPALGIGSLGGLAWHKVNKSLFAFTMNSPQSPSDVYTYDLNTARAQRWTSAYFSPELNPQNFVSPELVQIKSFDGLPISGWLYLPDARKFPGKRPVVMDFHGGPESQSTVRFMGRWNYYLNELGLSIFLPNVRGSSGYGKKFLSLDDGFLRKDSVKDGGAFLDWLRVHPRIDGNRIVVSGGSYGGYMSLAMAVDYGDKLRGAIDVVGISNFVSFLKNTESYRRDLRRVEYGDERDPAMRAFHEKIAPLNSADAIRIPLLVVHGKNDPRVPYTEAQQMVEAVRKNGVQAWYLLADNEGHGFGRKANADYQFYTSVMFLESVLLK